MSARISSSSPLVLGSGSPRRREILESLRIPMVVCVPDVDEDVHEGEGADAYLTRVVLAKLHAVRLRLAGPLPLRGAVEVSAPRLVPAILVSDTSVIADGAILGKPTDTEDARQMIRRLAGRTHEVHTRFALGEAREGPPLHAETVITRVTFRPLADEEIDAYGASGEGRDKAGAYAAQGLGASLIARIDGSYTNVVGLPASELVVALRALELHW